MSLKIDRIESAAEAENVSEIILESLQDSKINFNPFQGRIFGGDDEAIKFMGQELMPEEALQYIAN